MPRYALDDCFIKSFSTNGSAEGNDSFDFVDASSDDGEVGDRGFQDLQIKPPPKPRDDINPELSMSSDTVPDSDAPDMFNVDFII